MAHRIYVYLRKLANNIIQNEDFAYSESGVKSLIISSIIEYAADDSRRVSRSSITYVGQRCELLAVGVKLKGYLHEKYIMEVHTRRIRV